MRKSLFLAAVALLFGSTAFAQEGYKDDTISVKAYRLKLENKPKVAWVVTEYFKLGRFYIAYQPADGTVPLKATSPVIAGGGKVTDGRRTTGPNDKFGYFGDSLGKKNELLSDELVPNTDYKYWVIGTDINDPNKQYKSPQLAFKTTPLEGLKNGLLTDESYQAGRSSATFKGVIGKAKEAGIAYIEYGSDPSKLDLKTKEKSFSKGEDVWYSSVAELLLPGATYYYRLAAKYKDGDTAQGNILGFTLKPITEDPRNPCGWDFSAPLLTDQPVPIRLSEDIAVMCKAHDLGASVGYGLTKGGAVEDTLVCPEQFPRNLNTNALDLTIPKINVGIVIEKKGPGYMRTSEDVRFNEWDVWAKKGVEGTQQPLRQGSQKYWAINWNPKPQKLAVWIFCSKNWSAPNTFK
jgi:hypothetical protein